MDENKTGVWIQGLEGRMYPYKEADGTYKGIVGDTVIVGTSSMIATFRIEDIEFQEYPSKMICYKIKPMYLGKKDNDIWKSWKSHDCSDAKPIDMFLRDDTVVIIVPFDYDKSQYRTKGISSDEAMITFYEQSHNKMETIVFDDPTIGKTYPLQTMNEKCEIKTGTILADKIKVGISNRFLPAPTRIDWNGEMSATLTFSPEKIDEIMNKLTGNEEEKDMNTKNLKEMIKKPIYIDKEITVKEPVLDNNGKQIEKDGKPVFKVKYYHGMVKILWTSGAETVAYVEGNDVYDRENGFKTCVLKYLCGNAGAHDAVDFWTNKYVKYPSSCIEVTENLCKLEKILEKDKYRKDDQKGLPHAKFLRRIAVNCIAEFSSDKLHYMPNDSKLASEFKKLAKKYFPELKGTEIYINNNKQDEVFVAIK